MQAVMSDAADCRRATPVAYTAWDVARHRYQLWTAFSPYPPTLSCDKMPKEYCTEPYIERVVVVVPTARHSSSASCGCDGDDF